MKDNVFRNGVLATALAALTAIGTAHAEETDNDRGNAGQRLREQSAQTLQALQDYTAEQKDQAVVTAKKLLDQLDDQIAAARERLAEQWADLDEATRDEREAAIDKLERQRENLADAFDGLKENSGEAWSQVKRGFVDAYHTLTGDS